MADLRELQSILGQPSDQRLAALAAFAPKVSDPATREATVAALLGLIAEGVGAPRDRLAAGEALALLGDPRLRTPDQADYWVKVETDDGAVHVGRCPVTNAEYRRWVDAGGYETGPWTAEGRAWLSKCSDPWPVRSKAADAAPYIIDNQPVVGVTWFEADTYARAHGARLPRFDERVCAVRGKEKRPYPRGSPFGEGHANTQEEVLQKPCAVGLYRSDVTPEGLFDLAGNVAEWAGDGAGDQYWYAPGAFDEPSMAAWAKAREIARPDARWRSSGFRLAKD